MTGLHLFEAYKKLNRIDDDLSNNLDIAFDKNFGYLTACPTNLGTGLRASVMMFLPALSTAGKIPQLIKDTQKLGLTVRGIYGEGSNAEGYIYQISNEVTLGVSEQEILQEVERTVLEICNAEHDLMKKLFVRNELQTMDKARKSFGVLTNAVMLEYSEFLAHIANVKLGAMLGLLNITDLTAIDELIIRVRPANVCEQYGKKLTAVNRDLFRAEVVGKKLLKIKE
jgi:protein arginine kinase